MIAKEIQIVPNGRPPKSLAEAWAVDRIVPDPGQPRRTLDPAGIRELAENIRQHGLLHPLHLRPYADDRFMLISGARRLEAVKLLRWTHVPAIVHAEPLTTRELRLLQVSENLLREDVNPIEQALTFQDCLDGGTASQLAQELGVAVSTITRAIDLLKLPIDVQDLIRQGLPGTVARELARKDLDDDAKRDIARRYMAGEFKNRAEVIAAVRLAKNGPIPAVPESLACESAAGVKIRLDLGAGQGVKEASAALRELLADLSLHRAKTMTAVREFLAAKAVARKKAADAQAAQAALGDLTPPPAKETADTKPEKKGDAQS
jgi:ParB/RepB/Spo0J family partition protein